MASGQIQLLELKGKSTLTAESQTKVRLPFTKVGPLSVKNPFTAAVPTCCCLDSTWTIHNNNNWGNDWQNSTISLGSRIKSRKYFITLENASLWLSVAAANAHCEIGAAHSLNRKGMGERCRNLQKLSH